MFVPIMCSCGYVGLSRTGGGGRGMSEYGMVWAGVDEWEWGWHESYGAIFG